MHSASELIQMPPCVEVVIEIPRGSFLKRGSTGCVDFVSPFPCPFNYGSVRQYIGGEGDYLDAVVLGPRLAAGSWCPPGVRSVCQSGSCTTTS